MRWISNCFLNTLSTSHFHYCKPLWLPEPFHLLSQLRHFFKILIILRFTIYFWVFLTCALRLVFRYRSVVIFNIFRIWVHMFCLNRSFAWFTMLALWWLLIFIFLKSKLPHLRNMVLIFLIRFWSLLIILICFLFSSISRIK